MIEIRWDDKFKKIYKKWSLQHPGLKAQFEKRISIFEQDPFHPSIKTHSLSGSLKGLWSLRITYQYRLVFTFLDEKRTIVLLIDIGTHKEVY
jgi:Txe/YoeB family toxin of toxin-antitoxin system